MTAFSKVLIREGASLPLYPFNVEVLDYFKVVYFEFTLNSIPTMVAFYIAFIEANRSKNSAIKFAYLYCIKALARNEGFRYTSKRGPDVEEV